MKTRSSDSPKSAAVAKRTPPAAKKAAAKAQMTPPIAEAKVDSSTPEAVETKRASSGGPKQIQVTPNSEPEASVKQGRQVSTEAKPPGIKKVKKVIRKVIRKTPASAKAASERASASGIAEKANIEQTTEKKTVEDLKNTEAGNDKPADDDNHISKNVGPSVLEDENIDNHRKPSKKEEEEKTGEPEKHSEESGEELSKAIEPIAIDAKLVDAQEPCVSNEKVKDGKEGQVEISAREDCQGKAVEVENVSNEAKQENTSLEEHDDEKIEGLSDQEVHEEFGVEDLADDDAPENEAEAETLEEEHVQLNAAARERKVRKEREIFVGGLDRNAVEEDLRKVFEYAGQVVEVRMHVDPSTKKNKGYAFVQFATKEQANRALSEMKNPVIHGKRCGTAPCEDNVTLFLGNICNTWTKEAIKQKLKDYGIEGVENITLVADPRHEGLSRGFAFVEFSSHVEAMLAYKRLQKPDVVFGHSERTAKVAFAEPLREPDPEVMAQVKSVFVDGLPPNWDEDRVREKFRIYGDIARITLARNMSTAKRKDFGFVDFDTHEAAISCVEGVNGKGLNDGNSKVKVRARLSNPLPKMQAVKGGMRGGYRIGHGSKGTIPRFSGRGFGRGGRPFNRYGRGFYPRDPGHGGRMGFSNEHEFDSSYPPFHGRSNFGRGGRWSFRDAQHGPLPAAPYPDRLRHVAPDRGYGDYDSYRRYPHSFEEGYEGSFPRRHFDDPYSYDDVAHGIKRPYYMMDPNFEEPSRYRTRVDQLDPTVPFSGTRFRDNLGADAGLNCQNYYGPRYGGTSYSTSYGDDRAYGRGYYY